MGRNDKNDRDMDILVRWEVGSYRYTKEDGHGSAAFEKTIEGTILTKLGCN